MKTAIRYGLLAAIISAAGLASAGLLLLTLTRLIDVLRH